MAGTLRSLVALVALLIACGTGSSAQPDDQAVEQLEARIVAQYPHDPAAFTQGLVWFGGRLFESTGQYGASTLRRVDLESGEVERRIDLPEEFFAEGLERVGDRLVQLTWREQLALVYSLDSFERVEEWSYLGEGWGLCFDGVDLVRSDGTDQLTFHDAGSFAPLRQVGITIGGRPLSQLNELECVDGDIYANVYAAAQIVRIDPADGRVTALIDASGLAADQGGAGVLNGIAYRPETSTFLLTGKNWPKLFEVVLVEAE